MTGFEKAPVLTDHREKELLFFCELNKLSITSLELLNTAFTHSSFANEFKNGSINDNERLEFLGDSVLSLVVSEYLYNNYEGDEGDFSKIRSFAVSEDSLAEVAVGLHLDKYLLIGKGEELTGGRHKKAILADCMEAVFAAVFLDQGFDVARSFILKHLIPRIEHSHRDYKSLLQEFVQKRWKAVPSYNLVRTEGPEHNQVFWYTVCVHGKTYGPQSGHSKKEAEQNAAMLACTSLGIKE